MNQAKTGDITPLCVAAQEGHLPVEQQLLDHEAAVNQAQLWNHPVVHRGKKMATFP